MPATNDRFAYTDCLDVFDKAITSERGLRLHFADEGSARQFMMRMHKARALHREDNAETYPPSHPLHGRSEYDPYIIRLWPEAEGWDLTITKSSGVLQIEEL